MKRWTSIAGLNEDKRWNFLSQVLRQHGIENEYVPWSLPLADWNKAEILNEFDHVRLATRLGSEILNKLKVQSSWVTLLGVIDGMVKRDGSWWPLCALYESFGKMLVSMGTDMDMHGNVFVVGSGGAARVAVAAFFKAGFKHFLVTDHDQVEAEKNIKEFRRKFLGIDVQWVPQESIVLLPGETSVLVNCTPVENNNLLTELSYLNFLRRPGFLFDLNLTAQPHLLVHEAADAGVTIISGLDVASYSDAFWCKWAFNVDLDVKAYAQDLQSAIST